MWASRGIARSARHVVTCSSRSNSSLATVMHAQDPESIALLAPRQNIEWTYGDLSNRVGRLAGNLSRLGYRNGDVIATDLASCAENLLLQLAASHIGIAVVTLKGPEVCQKLRAELPVRGAVAENADSFLMSQTVPFTAPTVTVARGKMTLSDMYEQRCGRPVAFQGDAPLGYYGSASPVLNSTILSTGAAAQQQLGMKDTDVVLVSITLNHLFGIGSAVSAALQSGAAIVLPDASGVTGCGSPTQRAEATIDYLDSLKCSLLFADTHTLKALKEAGPRDLKHLRGGVCKVGSGSDFLPQTDEYAGVTLAVMGKK